MAQPRQEGEARRTRPRPSPIVRLPVGRVLAGSTTKSSPPAFAKVRPDFMHSRIRSRSNSANPSD
jgi:hypothetical protein